MLADHEDLWLVEFTWDVLMDTVVMVSSTLMNNATMVQRTEMDQMLAEPTVLSHTVVMVSLILITENGVTLELPTTTSTDLAPLLVFLTLAMMLFHLLEEELTSVDSGLTSPLLQLLNTLDHGLNPHVLKELLIMS
jgi:hypothetical protein